MNAIVQVRVKVSVQGVWGGIVSMNAREPGKNRFVPVSVKYIQYMYNAVRHSPLTAHRGSVVYDGGACSASLLIPSSLSPVTSRECPPAAV